MPATVCKGSMETSVRPSVMPVSAILALMELVMSVEVKGTLAYSLPKYPFTFPRIWRRATAVIATVAGLVRTVMLMLMSAL